jgi:hypothetical protein
MRWLKPTLLFLFASAAPVALFYQSLRLNEQKEKMASLQLSLLRDSIRTVQARSNSELDLHILQQMDSLRQKDFVWLTAGMARPQVITIAGGTDQAMLFHLNQQAARIVELEKFHGSVDTRMNQLYRLQDSIQDLSRQITALRDERMKSREDFRYELEKMATFLDSSAENTIRTRRIRDKVASYESLLLQLSRQIRAYQQLLLRP